MRLFEYEAKTLLKNYGIPIPPAKLIHSAEEVVIEQPSVLKAQVPSGGRKKAGGVEFVNDQAEAVRAALKMFKMTLKGYPVENLLVEDRISIQKEVFLAVTYDTASKSPIVIFSSEGGIDIEELAKTHPEKVLKETFGARRSFMEFQARNIGIAGGLKGKELMDVSAILQRVGIIDRVHTLTLI